MLLLLPRLVATRLPPIILRDNFQPIFTNKGLAVAGFRTQFVVKRQQMNQDCNLALVDRKVSLIKRASFEVMVISAYKDNSARRSSRQPAASVVSTRERERQVADPWISFDLFAFSPCSREWGINE
jgi:hypothetical protein